MVGLMLNGMAFTRLFAAMAVADASVSCEAMFVFAAGVGK